MKSSLLLSLLLTASLFAETPRVTNIVIFKNGLAFVTREGNVAFTGGSARVTPVPDAMLGTFWVSAGGRTIDEVRAVKEQMAGKAVVNLSELIDANAGHAVTIRANDRDYSGTLLHSAMSLLMINVDGKVVSLDRSAVQSIAFAQSPVVEPQVATPVLLIASRGADASVPLTLSYLRAGVSWMPEYAITLGDDGRTQITMQAMLINESEDLRDAHVKFAVGFPSFEFSEVQSPMAMQQTLAEFLARLGRGMPGGDTYANVATQQQVFVNVSGRAEPSVDPEAIAKRLEGETAEDLFFYDRANVTLAAGERALYPVFSESVAFRHVYVWEVPAETEDSRAAIERPADSVWHSIVLTNSGATPWTTAPAFVLSHGKPLAQSTLAYTAAGAHGTVKLTIATDVGVERQEVEVERKPRDLDRFGYHYDSVTIEGTLTVRNYKRDRITLSIAKNVEGTTISQVPEGKVTRRALRPKAVNPHERLEWELPLAAGEEKIVKYRYKVWVRE